MNGVLLINLSAYILLLIVFLGVIVFALREGVKALEYFIEKYVPSEKFVTLTITQDYIEDIAEEYHFAITDYPALLKLLRKEAWKSNSLSDLSPMESLVLDIFATAEKKGILLNNLETDLECEMTGKKSEEELEEELQAYKKSAIEVVNVLDKKFALKKDGDLVN